jgi:hypothetical protein
VETKNSRVEENGEQIMIFLLQELHVQRKSWRGHLKKLFMLGIYCVNDGKEVEVGSHQVMTHEMYYEL